MALNNNLQEQLRFLQENLSECHFAGFQYAHTASENIEVPAVFSFDTQKTRNSRNCSKQSVSDAGYLDLQTFRTEQSTVHMNNTEASSLQLVPITSKSTRSKFTELVNAPIAPRKKTSYNLQDEISRFQSAEPDSVFMDIDIDALVAAELAKADNLMQDSAPMVVDVASVAMHTNSAIPTGSYPTPISATTSAVASVSTMSAPPSNIHSYPAHTNSAQNTTYTNNSAYPSAPSTAHTVRTVHTVSSVASSNDRSSLHHSGSSTYSDHGAVSNAASMAHTVNSGNANSSGQDSETAARAVKEAELQKVKQDMRR